MENHDLLTAACATLEWVREEERQLEMEVSILQARLEMVRELRSRLEGKAKTRRGRPPKLVVEMVAPRVIGEIPTTEVEPPELETVA